MELPVTVGVDESGASLAAADWAAREARLRERPLRVVHALPLMPHLLPGRAARPATDGAALLYEVQHVLARRHPELCVRADEVHDLATAALVAAAEDAELLVLGARGDGGFPELRVGSTSLHVAARAGCPTVVVPAEPPGAGPHDQVVVGVDARRPADAALGFAFGAARRYGLPLRAVHAFPGRAADGRRSDETALLTRALEPWAAAHPDVELTADAEPTGAGLLLVEASAKARLLVIGRRPAASAGRLGPVAHAVLHHAGCPVAVVPGA